MFATQAAPGSSVTESPGSRGWSRTPERDAIATLRQLQDRQRFDSRCSRRFAFRAEVVVEFRLLLRLVSVQCPGPRLHQLSLMDVIESEVANDIRFIPVLVIQLEAVGLSHSVPANIGQVTYIDPIKVDQHIGIRGSDTLVAASYRRVPSPEPGVRSRVSIPGSHKNIVLSVTLQVD